MGFNSAFKGLMLMGAFVSPYSEEMQPAMWR